VVRIHRTHDTLKAAISSLLLATTGANAFEHLNDVYGHLDTEKFTVYAFSQNAAGQSADPQVLELVPDMNIRAVQKWRTWGDSADDYQFSNVDLYHKKGITMIAGGTAAALFADEVTDAQFEDMVTRDALNETVEYSEGRHNGSLANPAFREHILDYIKIQIDGGVDGVSLDEANGAGCQGGEKWSWNGNECFDDYFLADFNRYLMAKYPAYTAEDWKVRFGMSDNNVINPAIPADDLVNNFNYREYLAAHGFAEEPHNSSNPMSAEWGRVVTNRMIPVYGGFMDEAFDRYWYDLVVRIRDYARLTQGKEIYITSNGIIPYVDFNSMGMYNWNADNNGEEAPYVPVSNGHLQGSVSLQPYFKQFREYSQKISNGAPLVYFIDWPTDMIYAYHALTDSERKDYWRIYAAEAYANGAFFAFHLKTSMSEFDERMPQAFEQGMMAFFKDYAHFYRVNADYYHQVTPMPSEVTVSVDNIATSVMAQPEKQRLLVHLNNHNYVNQIVPQHDLTVTVPLDSTPAQVSVVSPDFVGRKRVPFTFDNGVLTLKIEALEFYDVIEISILPPQPQLTCRIGFQHAWDGGLSLQGIQVTNHSVDATLGWNACITFSREVAIDKAWGVEHVLPQGQSVCLSNAHFNGALNSDESAFFGLIAEVGNNDIDVLGCLAEPVVAKPDETLDCQYSVTENWETGFVAEVTVTNKTEETLRGWEVQYRLEHDAEMNQLWEADMTVGGDGTLSARNRSWNAQIDSGGSQTFGMLVNKPVVGSAPTITFTGGDCRVTEFLNDLPGSSDPSASFVLPERQPDVDAILSWSDASGGDYGLYLPTAPADAELPIVLFLHDYADGSGAENHRVVKALNAIEPVAVFIPQRSIDEGITAWGTAQDSVLTRGMSAALAQLYQVQQTYKTSSQRIYVYGEGMGADGVYRLLLEYPDVIAGAVTVAGSAEPVAPNVMAQMPLWIFHGSEDSVSPATASQNIYQAISAAGGKLATYTEYEGMAHRDAILAAASEPSLAGWLLSQHR